MADAKTHSMQILIDASGAEVGAKKFKSAINSIMVAMKGLERDTDGVFTKLKNITPKIDVSTLKVVTAESNKLSGALGSADAAAERASATMIRTQLASATAVRQSTNAVQRLRLRLLEVGDTAAIDRSTQRLVALGRATAQATSLLQVRQAKNTFQEGHDTDSRSAINAQEARWNLMQQAKAEETATRAASLHANELESLALKYNPLRANSMAYAQSLEEISRAESAGVLSSQMAEAARTRAAASLATSRAQMPKSRANGAAIANVSAQFQDVAVMMAAGQNPFQLAMQQGTQLSAVLNQMGGKVGILKSLAGGFMQMVNPVSLVTIGVILAGSAIVNWLTSADEKTKTFSQALGDSTTAISNLSSATDTFTSARLGSLVSGYGLANAALLVHLDRLREVATLEAMTANRDNIGAAASGITTSYLNTDLDDFRNKLGLTNDSAREFMALLDKVKTANTFDSQSKAITKSREFLNDLGISLQNSEGEAALLLASLVKAEDASLKLKAAAEGSGSAIAVATSQTNAWASAMGGVAAQISAIMAGLSSISGGAINFAAGRAELIALNAGKSVESAAQDRARTEMDLKLRAQATSAESRGKPAAWINSGLAAVERSQFESQLQQTAALNAAREAARKRDTASTKGGGGGRVADLGSETGQLAKLSKQMNDRIFKIGQENDALRLLATGQASSKESAELQAAAMALNGGAMDTASRSTVALYDAQIKLQRELEKNAANPLKDYLDSLPTAISTTRQASADMASALQDGIAGAMTGELDVKGIVDNLRRSLAKNLSGVLTGKLLGKFGDHSGVAQGAQVGAGIMSTAIMTGSAAGARMFAAAVSGAAIPAAGGAASGGGGFLGTALSFLGGLFSEGGYSDSPAMSSARMSPATFNNAPHYKEGTANTSGGGIPSILHPNEAVIPLSRGRKIPVEMLSGGNTAKDSSGNTFHLTNNISIDGAGGDMSNPEVAAIAAKHIAQMVTLKVQEEMASAMRYGGMMRPRGS